MNGFAPQSLFSFFILLLALQVANLPVANSQSKVEKIDQLMKRYTEYGQFNGSVLVAEKGTVIYMKGHGWANMEWDIPNQADTKHRIGSITKQFTGMLILQLVEKGKLDLQVPISTYLPNYPEAIAKKVSLHHLLTHTSGIPNYTALPGFFAENSRKPYTPEAFVEVFADLPLDFEPGEQFNYSNSGYFLLGVIIEKITGKTCEQVLQEQIFTPLEMNHSGFDHHDVILKNRARGYEKDGKNYVNAAYIDMSIPYAAGSMYSSVEDLYLWDQALYTDKLLSQQNMELFFKPQVPAFGAHYAYGWSVGNASKGGTEEKIAVTEHGGGINGFNTLISRVTTDKHLVVLFNNTGGAALDEMNRAIQSILYDLDYEMPKRSLAMDLLEGIQAEGYETALERFNALKNDPTYGLKENEMNAVGYQLLGMEKVKEAINVFKMNVDTFPNSGNVYDSLGEAYLIDGNKEMAIKNYKKSVEIDPKNTHGMNVLKELEAK